MDGKDGRQRLVLIERQEVQRLGRAIVAGRELGDGWTVEGLATDDLVDGSVAVDQVVGASSVIVAVAADGPGFDRFDAVRVVRAVAAARLHSGRPAPRLVAAVGVAPNPLLHIRLAAAGVDRVVGLTEVSGGRGSRLAELVGSPVLAEPPTPGGAAAVGTDPEAVLDYVRAEGLEAAFEPGLGQQEVGLSRRRIMGIRRDIARLGGIRPSLDRYTGGAHRRIDIPTWREIVAYVNCARGEIGWEDDAWGHGSGPRIGTSRSGLADLETAARALVA